VSQSDRVLIFGGAGFIGRHLVSQLRGKVESITVVSRRAAGAGGDSEVRYVGGDIMDRAQVMSLVAGSTVVYQLTMESDYVVAARNLAEACLAHGVRRVIFASTSDALYLGRKGRVDESAGTDSKPELRNSYSCGKTRSEQLFLELHKTKGLPIVIMRPCLVVGRGGKLQHGGIGSWKTATALVGWGDGKHPMPFVLAQDVAAAMVLALDAPGIEGKAFNLAGDVYLSAREYVRLAGERTLRNFRFYPRNLFLFHAKVSFKTAVKRLLGRKSAPQSYRDLKSAAMLTQIDNRLSKELLGWRPNADLNVFIREAIDPYAGPFAAGDLRLTGGESRAA
jgi:nucleoside-diphosphate-sugar epimerase